MDLRTPIGVEEPADIARRLREEDEQRELDRDARWEAEERGGLGPWGAWAHRLARSERARRAQRDTEDGQP